MATLEVLRHMLGGFALASVIVMFLAACVVGGTAIGLWSRLFG